MVKILYLSEKLFNNLMLFLILNLTIKFGAKFDTKYNIVSSFDIQKWALIEFLFIIIKRGNKYDYNFIL